MKHNIFRTLLTLAFAAFTLPMLSQDFMNIYFKNGDFRKFYMKNITEIVASKVDKEGVQHSDYCSQSITTIYDTYVYDLEDVDSITFTKIDEEKAEHNFVTAMPEVFSAIDGCETIEDVEEKIDIIRNTEGVADAWSDGHQLYVTIDEGETISFHFNHNVDIEDEAWDKYSAQIRAIKPRLGNLANNDGTPLKAVIANQQHNDENRKDDIDNYFNRLSQILSTIGIIVHYVESPTIDFFYDNCQNPEPTKHLNFYDYDIIFLNTHGSYSNIRYRRSFRGKDYGEKKGEMSHSMLTSEEIDIDGGDILKIPSKAKDVDDLPSDWWKDNYDSFNEWRAKTQYKDISDQYINFAFTQEKRDGSWYWVAHPCLTEFFFRDIALGEFMNPNSILFNTACQSLKGDKPDQPSYSLANILFNERGLGVYIGYTETNFSGQRAGTEFLDNMALGYSIETSIDKLPKWCKEETLKNIEEDNSFTEETLKTHRDNPPKGAKLEKKYSNKTNVSDSFFLYPVVTIKPNNDIINQEYNNNNTVTLTGFTTRSKIGTIETGFEFGSTPYLNELLRLNNNVKIQRVVNNQLGNYQFETTISNLTPGEYYYRAYTFDSINTNYGETYSFKIEILPDLQVSTTSLTLELGKVGIVQITGSGDFEAISSDPETVTVSINELREGHANLLIQTLKAGPATITVKDTKTGQTTTIQVEVTQKADSEVETFTVNGVSFDMMKVEGGTFMMGTNKEDDYYVNSRPLHQVSLSSILLGKYEVTQELWQAVMGSNPSSFKGTKLPVENVSWDDCQEFIRKLNEFTGKKFRLPTEAEWEFAAKGGNKSKGYKYSGSDIIDQVAWYVMNNNFSTQVVGQKSPNELGLYDMSGNVWEWCQDWMNLYSDISQTNPTGPSSGKHRVIRGGSFGGGDLYCEVINRGYREPNHKNTDLGMRLALAIDVSFADLVLSVTDPININIGESKSVTITSGNGDYTVNSNPDGVVTVSIDGEKLIINANSAGPATITVTDTKTGQTAKIEVTVTAQTNLDINLSCPDSHHPHWIDLGLPSGTLWQCCNEGASRPEEYGGYYLFGQVSSAPSLEQCQEMIDNCTSEWTSLNGIDGRKFTSRNGTSIFFPAAGHKWTGSNHIEDEGMYVNMWTSTPYVDPEINVKQAYLLGSLGGSYGDYLGMGPVVCDSYSCSVRPVKLENKVPGVVNLIRNSNMEGTDVSSFLVKTPGMGDISPQATITDGVGKNGSRGIKVEATKKENNNWDNQFWLYFDQPVSNGTKYRLSFSCRADKDANVSTQFHVEPGINVCDLETWKFLQEWNDYEIKGTISYSSDMEPIRSIDFLLSTFSDANTYYFDNIKFEVFLDGKCPKPTFISNGNELSIHSPFTTAIYYTLDGSEPTTSSSLYTSPLTLNQSCTVKALAVVDGSNISPVASYKKIKEDTPPAGYVSLRNVPFCSWDDWGANATSTGSADCLWIVGESASAVYGDGLVINYADLSNYSKLIVKVASGTPRLLFNRDVNEGLWNSNEELSHLIEIPKNGWPEKYYTVEYTDEGKIYTVDLEQITRDKGYCHLHAIKGQNGSVTVKGMYVKPLN